MPTVTWADIQKEIIERAERERELLSALRWALRHVQVPAGATLTAFGQHLKAAHRIVARAEGETRA